MIWPAPRPQIARSATEPAPSVDTGPPPPVLDAETTGGYEPVIAPCGCFAVIGDDDSIDRLRDLVRAGMGQMEASKVIWGVSA